MSGLKEIFISFVVLYLISFAAMYYISKRAGGPMILPGDIYRTKPGSRIYVPTGGAFILAILLFVVVGFIRKSFGLN